MCTVSMVMDDWTNKVWPNIMPATYPWHNPPQISINPDEFIKLKIEVEELKKKLKEARARDIAEDVPDCKMKESAELIKLLAEKLGVDLEDILDGHKAS